MNPSLLIVRLLGMEKVPANHMSHRYEAGISCGETLSELNFQEVCFIVLKSKINANKID